MHDDVPAREELSGDAGKRYGATASNSTREHPGEQAHPAPVRLLEIRDTPLSLDEVFRAVGDDAAGGTALFVGTVRNHDLGMDVGALSYSCHPTAEAELHHGVPVHA